MDRPYPLARARRRPTRVLPPGIRRDHGPAQRTRQAPGPAPGLCLGRALGLCLAAVLGLVVVGAVPAAAQSVPNGGFDVAGADGAPAGWRLDTGDGAWRLVDGDRALVTSGDAEATSYWASDPLDFAGGTVYRLRYRARRLAGSGGGTAITGTAFANRDLGAIGQAWRVFNNFFAAPWSSPANPDDRGWLRFGQWHLDGGVAFDDIELDRVQPVHARPAAGLELGEGERIEAGRYVFHAPQRTQLANVSRPLAAHDAGFNTYRWVFGAGQFVRYRHEVGGRLQRRARVVVDVNYHQAGRLVVEARRQDPAGPAGVGPEAGPAPAGAAGGWTVLGQVDSVRSAAFDVPAELLPAHALAVRLRASGGRQVGADADPGSFQVDDYRYEAQLDDAPADATGRTQLLTVTFDTPVAQVRLLDAGELQPGLADTLVLEVDLATSTHQRHQVEAGLLGARARAVVTAVGELPGPDPAGDGAAQVTRLASESGKVVSAGAPDRRAGAGDWIPVTLVPGTCRVRLPYRVTGTGDRTLHVELETRDLAATATPELAAWRSQWRAELDVHASILHADDYGEALPVGGDVAVWWASSGWKVSSTRRAPETRGAALRLAAARHETEAAQLVLRPPRPLAGLTVVPQRLEGPEGARLRADAIEVLRVATVPVQQPTDVTGEVADWPDPLLPLTGPLRAAAQRNLTLWLRVTPPRGTPAGLYRGVVALRADGWTADVPVEVTVFDFDLPERMTCQTAFGFSPGAVWTYQRLEDEADRRAVLDRYLDSFAAHHISPYDPAPLEDPEITWPDLGGRRVDAGDVIEPEVDWTAWDAAMTRAIDEGHFNTFAIPIPGMGGGTFVSRRAPQLQGWSADTPQYQALFRGYGRALQRHLAAKGWLDEAFVYWFDEPAPRDYEFVMDGFRRLAAAAPRIRRMLTEQPEAELFGGPTLWCPVMSSYDEAAAAARVAAGDRFWWYICTVPKAPYPGEFIDHPGTELRVWLWQTWQRDIDGILIWATNHWTSDAAYADSRQDPYRDPMSWTSSYNAPVGTRRPWGNGDGRFLYPPLAAVADTAAGEAGPILAGPVETIRWELLRDGIEDYEYLAMLERALAEKGKGLGDEERAAWSALLEVPASITTSATQFTTDPAPIEARRLEIARALEALARR